MGGTLVGSLLRFDGEKRDLFHPTAPEYPEFEGQVGLCVSHRINSKGDAHVAVQWLKPVKYHNQMTTKSHFALDNFVVVGSVNSGQK